MGKSSGALCHQPVYSLSLMKSHHRSALCQSGKTDAKIHMHFFPGDLTAHLPLSLLRVP